MQEYFFFCLRQSKCEIIDIGAQLCSTLCDPMEYSPPDSSVHGIFQTRILVLPFPSPSDFPDPRLNLCLLSPVFSAWQSDSLPLHHLGSCVIAG